MENPFESGHIKNYILLYVSVVVIMVLFFIASSLFNDIESVEKREFLEKNIDENSSISAKKIMRNIVEVNASKFKLMPKVY